MAQHRDVDFHALLLVRQQPLADEPVLSAEERADAAGEHAMASRLPVWGDQRACGGGASQGGIDLLAFCDIEVGSKDARSDLQRHSANS